MVVKTGVAVRLGELAQFGRCLTEERASPGPQHRVVGGKKRIDSSRHGGWIGRLTRHRRRHVVLERALGDLLPTNVGRQLDDDRTARTVTKRSERPAHGRDDVGRPTDRFGRLGHPLVVADGGVVRSNGDLARARPARQNQDGDVVGKRLGDAAECILGAGLGLDRHHTETLAIARTAVAIGRHDRTPLVTKRNRTDADPGRGLDERIVREACDPYDALALQYAGDQLVAVHWLTISYGRGAHKVRAAARSRARDDQCHSMYESPIRPMSW